VLANDLSLSIRNPFLIYTFLALNALLTLAIVTYVHAKFRVATKTLKSLQTEWTNAESTHASIVGAAQEHLSKLSAPPPRVMTMPAARGASVGFDVRNQVVTMARRGMGIADIARNCGLHEGEVEVLLGMARLTKGN
jgi:hypothetical protein